MDEDAVLLKIGELTGLMSAMATRISTMHDDNGIKYAELLSQIGDIKAQTHEIKHAQSDAAQKVVILEQKTSANRETHNTQHRTLIEKTEELKKDIFENRITNSARFEELFNLKNKFMGIGIFIMLLISILGKEIWDALSNSFHLFGK